MRQALSDGPVLLDSTPEVWQNSYSAVLNSVVSHLFSWQQEFANVGRTDFQGQTAGTTLRVTVSARRLS